eukprot:TRINITY_DN16319_c0_g1_i1.p1 TRINITY_DN16319_c0_g1~~TRINITY_DN16319_c0_g1_i1.p1  ORF type:complete len:462 (+),score=117.64 TRINITY_DN16319_c0_g1_i1:47-1432(+)
METIVEDAISWSLAHGFSIIAPAISESAPAFLAVHAPFALRPSPFPAEAFQQAVELAKDYNELYHHVSRDSQFLKDTLAKAGEGDPDFTGKLLEIYNKVPIDDNQITLGLHRSDYMLHQPEDGVAIPLQVEFNTISSSFANLSAKATHLHNYLIQRRHLKLDACNIPQNPSNIHFPEAISEAWKLYNNKDAVVVMVVQKNERNIFDQRMTEYHLLEKHNILVWRRTLSDIAERAQLNENGALVIDGREVAVTYFRAGYGPGDYTSNKEWEARELIERSKTIKSPTIAYQLAGAKKVQQELAKPGVLDRFLSDAAQIARIRASFAGLWGLEDEDEVKKLIEMVKARPTDFVLKPQREGGGNNIYGEEVLQNLLSMDSKTRGAYILMEKIKPKSFPARLVRMSQVSEEVECTSELGVYSVILSEGDKILKSSRAGHLLRTKQAHTSEGGVAAGYAFLDSPYLQ